MSFVRWLFRALLFFGVCGTVAQAAEFYACDCAAGAAAQCVAGNDNAAGTSDATPWRTYERARLAWGTLAAGDSVRFCRGGVFPVTASSRWVNTACRANAPCTIEAYLAPWGNGSEARPRLQRETGSGFAFDDTGTAEHEEGVVLRDLEMTCSACTDNDNGVFLYNDIDDVRLQRLSIRGFGIGVYVGGSNGCSAGAANCDGTSERVSLLDSEIRDSTYHGLLGGGDDLLIADNVFERNGTGTILEHNIYLGGNMARVQVLRNTLYRSAAVASGRCQGASLVAHGRLDDLLVEGNLVYEDLGGAEGSCWGINLSPGYSSPERFLRAVVRGNTVINTGTAGIALSACVDCLVENNVIVHAQPHAIIAIRAPAASFGNDDAVLSALRVRNNSIHVATTNSVGISVGGEGSGHVVVGNAIQSAATTGFWHCLSLDLPTSAYAAIDHNVCGYNAGSGREWELGSGALPAWRTASGFDLNSVAEMPGFAAPEGPHFDLSAASAAAPMVARGHPALGAPTDILGQTRVMPFDAGAYQFAGGQMQVFADGFE